MYTRQAKAIIIMVGLMHIALFYSIGKIVVETTFNMPAEYYAVMVLFQGVLTLCAIYLDNAPLHILMGFLYAGCLAMQICRDVRYLWGYQTNLAFAVFDALAAYAFISLADPTEQVSIVYREEED